MPARIAAIGLALTSALLFWLAFFPVQAGWLGWVALVPLLMLCRLVVDRRGRYLAAWIGGMAFFLGAVCWMCVADATMVVGWFAGSVYCSVYWPAAVYFVRRFDRLGWPLAASAAVVWPALDHTRGWLWLGGFPWYYPGHTQHDFLPLIQSADLFGVYWVTLLVVAVNGLIADAFTTGLSRRPVLIVMAALVATLGYGHWQLSQDNFATGPVVSLLQGNIPQGVKNDSGEDAATRIVREYVELQDRAAAARPDLMIWPETSFPVEVAVVARGSTIEDTGLYRGVIESSLADIGRAGQRLKTPNLIGTNCTELGLNDSRRRSNSAVLIEADGRMSARYDKIHRVPFGEYVPFVDWMPFLKKLTPYEGMEYSVEAGTQWTRFPVKDKSGTTFKFGVLICYEDSDSPLAREYVRGPDPVDFLVNISNDGWFKGTQEHEEHLAVSRFRAVECRRSLVRAVNMGVSAIVDPNGKVIALPGKTWSDSKAISGVVTATVPIDRRTSYYVWWGDWLPWTFWLIMVVACWKVRRSE
ncbi:MAG: apolipoprotein N-acyltransferase [Gemmataceae bacterium]|nr:apolipoprotein N-acyltransferase [Gemmataceae bacterium]